MGLSIKSIINQKRQSEQGFLLFQLLEILRFVKEIQLLLQQPVLKGSPIYGVIAVLEIQFLSIQPEFILLQQLI